MGANAVTSVPVYTAGENLTAADLNITNSGIPVFADSSARDAAFGGSGEKVLAEGQYAFLEDSDTTQFYDGASWQGIGGGMTLLSTTTLSGASTAITGISQDYVNLFITIEKWYASSAAALLGYMNANTTSANYLCSLVRARGAGAPSLPGSAVTYELSGWSEGPGQHDNLVVVTIPYYTSSSNKTYSSYGMIDTDNGTKGSFIGATAFFSTAAITSITFAPSAGTWSAGTVKIYGVK